MAKAMSAPYHPVICTVCGGLSAEPTGVASVLNLIHAAAPYFLIIWAFFAESLVPIIGYVAIAAMLHTLLSFALPLVPLSEESVKDAKLHRIRVKKTIWLTASTVLFLLVVYGEIVRN